MCVPSKRSTAFQSTAAAPGFNAFVVLRAPAKGLRWRCAGCDVVVAVRRAPGAWATHRGSRWDAPLGVTPGQVVVVATGSGTSGAPAISIVPSEK